MDKPEKAIADLQAKQNDSSVESAPTYDFSDYGDLIDAINEQCQIAPIGKEMFFVFRGKDGAPIFRRKKDADIALAPYRYITLVKDRSGKLKEKIQSGFYVWLKSPNRSVYDAVVFNPNKDSIPANVLNLWTGFGVESVEGDWGLMKAHILNNVCKGNNDHFAYLMSWLSQLFFEPERKSGVTVVLRGPQGVGKSKLGECIRRLIGKRHSCTIDKPEHLTRNFNQHLALSLFILVEEAVFAGDPRAKQILKHLTTSQDMIIESKGIDALDSECFFRILMTTNEDWAVPVQDGDRRYFVLDVGDAQKENKEYFAAIDAQMEAGGYGAMLFDLQNMKSTFRELGKPPMTAAKADQIRIGMSPQTKWLASVLEEGRFPMKNPMGPNSFRAKVMGLDESDFPSTQWELDGCMIDKDTVYASYREFVSGYRSNPTPEEIGLFMRKAVPGLETGKRSEGGRRVATYRLPALKIARETFLRAHVGFEFVEQLDCEAGPDNVIPINTAKKATA